MNASVASMIYKFNMNNIDILEELGYQVDVACNFGKENPISQKEILDFRNVLKQKNICVFETTCPRNIFAVKNMLTAYKQLKKIAGKEDYDLVHTQSPIGGVVCRLAFRKARKKGTKIIYQAHGFHFYKDAPKVNWLFFYPLEKICSYLTDILITINKEDYRLAKRKFHAKRVEYVPGVGIDISKFNCFGVDKGSKCQELGVSDEDTVLLSVGELNENKNHCSVIKALGCLRNEGLLQNVKYLICGQGDKRDELEQIAKEQRLENIVKFLGFRTDVSEIYKVADIFIFPSFREGLSVALMESMCCGLPVLCSKIRGNIDLIGEQGGILFKPGSVDEIKEAIQTILAKSADEILSMGSYNQKMIQSFSIGSVAEKMKKLYGEI